MDDQRLILVVEDDDVTRSFLLENFRAEGFRVAGASSAGEGLRAIEVRRPSLVLLDLALKAGSGLELLDRVRASDGLASRIDPDLPVIVLTGRTGEADRRGAVEPHARLHAPSTREGASAHPANRARLLPSSTSRSLKLRSCSSSQAGV
jgi:CheY-like chemotaxis protein